MKFMVKREMALIVRHKKIRSFFYVELAYFDLDPVQMLRILRDNVRLAS